MAADRRIHLRKVLGDGKRRAAGRAVGADRDDPRDAGLHRGGDQLSVGRLAQPQMRVAVDHDCFGNSGSSARTERPPALAANTARSYAVSGEPSASRSCCVLAGM